MWVTDHSRSLKVVPFESLGAVSYSPSIVTMAVSVAILEIFSVIIRVWGCSRSLKMVRCDRPRIAHLVPFASYLTLNNTMTLKSGLQVTQGH